MQYLIDLHTHTIASDHAYSTIMENVSQARLKGMNMIAITDHGPDVSDGPHPWHFNNLRVVPRIAEGVAVLRGIEANVTADGGLDLDETPLRRLDIVLAGFHPNYLPTTKEEHTRLICKVMREGLVDIVSHPGVAQYPVDYEEFLLCAKECNVAVEINSSSSVNTRMGSHENCVKIGKLASKIGNLISLGSDAHIAYFIGCFEESLKVLNESGVKQDQIINTSPNKVLDFLESRGHAPIKELREHFKDIA